MSKIALDVLEYCIRIVLVFLGFDIVRSCFKSMRNSLRGDRPLIMLVNKKSKEEIPVVYWENSIGRSKNSDIIIDDPSVSRDHAVLFRRESGWIISDTGSKSGVFINQEKVDKSREVYVNDEITVGSTSLILKKYTDVKEGKIASFFNVEKRKKPVSQGRVMVLVTIFHLLMCAPLALNNYEMILPFLIVSVVAWMYFIIAKFVFRRVNFELEILAFFLSGIGIILIAGADFNQIYMQSATMAIGVVLFSFIVWFIRDLDRVVRWRNIIAIGAILLFALNLLLGKIQHGAQNWIVIGTFSIQPSEFIKIAYIFVGASTLDRLQTKKNLTEFIAFSALCIGALFVMGDFGTACIFFLTFLVISFIRSGDIKTIILICSAAAMGAFMILKFKPYVANRFAVWRHVWEHVNDAGYQQSRVLTYCASGGLFGVGVGNGKLKDVFAATSDLIFGMICEEMGLIMAIMIGVLIAMLSNYARKMCKSSRSTFYSIASCSAAALLVFQSCLNIFGSTDILPLTGVTLPFISLGGSSMISVWGLLAFIKASDERTYAIRRGRR